MYTSYNSHLYMFEPADVVNEITRNPQIHFGKCPIMLCIQTDKLFRISNSL